MDRLGKKPMGKTMNVLIKIGELIFPVDFIILETQPMLNL